MNRFGVFVDAGYLIACGVGQCLGRPAPRTAVQIDYLGLIRSLHQHCQAMDRDELLRMYWYDGAFGGIHGPDHLAIAAQPDVKVRLGRVTKAGGQKGVDSLIVLDMTTLARERGIVSAYLVSGDEDLREGVLASQQLGVRVTLLGVSALGSSQSQMLIREADRHEILPKESVAPFFRPLPPPAQLIIPEVESEAAVSADESRAISERAEASSDERERPISEAEESAAFEAGVAFADSWLANDPPGDDLIRLSDAKRLGPRRLPTPLDALLIKEGSNVLGLNVLPRLVKRSLRRGFWSRID